LWSPSPFSENSISWGMGSGEELGFSSVLRGPSLCFLGRRAPALLDYSRRESRPPAGPWPHKGQQGFSVHFRSPHQGDLIGLVNFECALFREGDWLLTESDTQPSPVDAAEVPGLAEPSKGSAPTCPPWLRARGTDFGPRTWLLGRPKSAWTGELPTRTTNYVAYLQKRIIHIMQK